MILEDKMWGHSHMAQQLKCPSGHCSGVASSPGPGTSTCHVLMQFGDLELMLEWIKSLADVRMGGCILHVGWMWILWNQRAD